MEAIFRLLLFLVSIRQNYAQLTAVITPRGFNASLDPEASFTFQCDVNGTDNIQWVIDGSPSSTLEIRDRGVRESNTITVDEATDRFRSSLSILRNNINRNTTIACLATTVSPIITGNTSEPVQFKIQGLLDAPSNLMLSDADNQRMRRLSWEEPFSLDITDVDPDIECYNVCYSLVNVTAEKSQCTCVNQTEYTFLCVSVPLLFTVSAVNVVGEGGASAILHDGSCGCTSTTAPSIVTAKEVVSFPLSQKNPMAKFLFQQLPKKSGTMICFFIYEIETFLLLEANLTNHGGQIPGVVQYSQSSVHLSLTVDSDLLVNEQYLATITAINADGERNISVTVEFDTYDVQSVSGRVLPGGLELDCTFAEGSQAQSCILTVCRLENGMEEYCMDLTIARGNLQQSGQLTGLQPGVYTVKNVTEVESDGSMTLHRITDALRLNITEPPLSTRAPDSPSVGGVANFSTLIVVVGGIVAAVVMLLLAVIVVTVAVAYHHEKVQHRNQETPQLEGAVYEEPYDWAVSRLPQTEPEMEQCPAYGVLTII